MKTNKVAFLNEYLRLLRPQQYLKNLLLFFPLFFALKIKEVNLLEKVFSGFISFCLIASAAYIFNDISDSSEDKKHPIKCQRPLVSGKVSFGWAFCLMFALVALAAIISLKLPFYFSFILLIYFFVNISYSLWLKNIPIIDVCAIALALVLRIFAGSAAIENEPSMWIVLITFLAALFLALSKRRIDLLSEGQISKNINGYNLDFINSAMNSMASVVIIAYFMYSISPEITYRFQNQYLHLTTIFVIIGMMRYMQVSFVESKSDNPTKIFLTDYFLQLTIFAWLISFVFILY